MLKKLTILKQVKAMVPMRAATVFAHAATALVPMAAVFVMVTVLVSCADEGSGDQYADEETDMDFSVTAAWQPGRVLAGTRSVEVPAIEDFVTLDGPVPYSVYPNSIWMEVSNRAGNGSYTFTLDDFEATATTKAHPQHFIIAKGDFKKTGVTDDAPTGWLDYHNQFLIKNYGVDAKVSPKPFYKKSEMKGFVINAFWPWKRKVDNTANPVVDFPATPTPFATDADGKLTEARHWTNDDVPTFGKCDFMYDHIADAESEGRIEGHHLKLEMKHAMAMLRLYFCDSEAYERVRHIVLRSVKITKVGTTTLSPAYEFTINASQSIDSSLDNLSTPTVDESLGFLLTTTSQLYAYGYMKPTLDDNVSEQKVLTTLLDINAETWNSNAISTNTPITLECTYDIYDKDIVEGLDPSAEGYKDALATALARDLSAHCTRRSITATNTTTLSRVFNSTSGGTQATPITQLQPGYYYDLKITINPEYLYVLSQHDNKHITIN